MRILELFAGIGARSKALKNLGIEHEIVDAVEIDKYAVASFNAIHGTNFEVQDITEWDKEVDLITHGSPCQDFSVAGLQAGGDEGSGTRSSLMYESIRIINKLKPKYVLWENVKNLLSKKHKPNFDKYIETLDEMGYNSYYKVLNAKNYGIPQNRERVYTVSIRKDIDDGSFVFPEEKPLTLRLKDLLEDEVDEKYYIKSERVSSLLSQLQESNQIKDIPCCCDSTINDPKVREVSNAITARYDAGIQNQKQIGLAVVEPKCIQVGELDMKGHDQMKRVYSEDGLSPTLTTMGGGNREPKIAQKIDYKGKEVELPCIGASRGRNPENPSDRTPGNYVEQRLEINSSGTSNTLTSVQKDNLVIETSSYIDRKYKEFEDEKGYIPEMFNPYNKSEIKDVAPTQSTQCGSTTSSATVLIKEVNENE